MLRASVRRIHTQAQEVSWLTAWINNNPFKFGVGVTTTKTVCADMFVQKVIEKRDWDARRTMLFACFGFSFQGSFQYGLINWVIEPTFPGKSLRNIVTKILCMNLIVDPILFLPTFYSFRVIHPLVPTSLPAPSARALRHPTPSGRALATAPPYPPSRIEGSNGGGASGI